MRNLGCGLLAAIIAVTPLMARADIIVEPFSLTIPLTVLASGFPEPNNIFSTEAPQFPPNTGMLHTATYAISGAATWTSSGGGIQRPGLAIILIGNGVTLLGGQDFPSPGDIFVDLSDGVGASQFHLIGVDIFTPNTGDTFAATHGALSGTVTYDFVPLPVVPVPVPSLNEYPIASLALLVVALACLTVRKGPTRGEKRNRDEPGPARMRA
jgi:hypothetical protein